MLTMLHSMATPDVLSLAGSSQDELYDVIQLIQNDSSVDEVHERDPERFKTEDNGVQQGILNRSKSSVSVIKNTNGQYLTTNRQSSITNRLLTILPVDETAEFLNTLNVPFWEALLMPEEVSDTLLVSAHIEGLPHQDHIEGLPHQDHIEGLPHQDHIESIHDQDHFINASPSYTNMDAATLETNILKSSIMASSIIDYQLPYVTGEDSVYLQDQDYHSEVSLDHQPLHISMDYITTAPMDIPCLPSLDISVTSSSSVSMTSGSVPSSMTSFHSCSPRSVTPVDVMDHLDDTDHENKKSLTAPKFLLSLLEDPKTNPDTIYWVDQDQGIFRIAKSQMLAKLWAESRKKFGCRRVSSTYENFSRTIRHRYKTGEIVQEDGRLTYRFGPKGPYQAVHDMKSHHP